MNKDTADFLEELTNLYRHCDTYEDTGMIQDSITVGEFTRRTHFSFSTFYKHPGHLSLNFWFTDDPSQNSISVIYTDGCAYAHREGSGVPAKRCSSLRAAIDHVGTFCSLSDDSFVLAIPALLEQELRNSCESNFFDENCELIERLNSKVHLHGSDSTQCADVWFRANLTVHDVEIQSVTEKSQFLATARQVFEQPALREIFEKVTRSNPEFLENLEEHVSDTVRKTRRVFSHVLFDQDIDKSVFEVPRE